MVEVNKSWYLLVMLPSLGSARFWLELWTKKLGSARLVRFFKKLGLLKIAQNEPNLKVLTYLGSRPDQEEKSTWSQKCQHYPHS